ncbi:MAG: TA system VapC family ribonuclease toxin [Vicinamibacterales bacterium]
MGSRVALLDVNVLIALFFPDHVHHEIAHDWFADHRRYGWATCPVTENGFVRVVTQLRTERGIVRPSQAIQHLTDFCSDRHHHHWQTGVSLTDARLFAPENIPHHKAVTDVYLLGLAHTMKGCLATFDRSVPLDAVRGALGSAVQVIGPVSA